MASEAPTDDLARPSEMVEVESALTAGERSDVLFRVDPEQRQKLVAKIYGIALAEGARGKRTILRAAQVASTFDRVNLSYRLAGFGDFASGHNDPGVSRVDLDRDFLRYARRLAIEYAAGKRATDSISLRTASPLTVATYTGRRSYIPARHLQYLDERVCRMIDHAERQIDGPRIILVDAPPRHGKSEYCSRWLPSWYIGKFPERQVMLASYSDSFAAKWGRVTKDTIVDVGRKLFDIGIAADSRAAKEWLVEGRRGGMVSAGIGGSLTGRGANLLIIDDPLKNAEEAISETVRKSHWDWWQSTAWTRLEPRAVVLVIMTRWHQDDLAGKIKKWAADRKIAVESISFPAIAGQDDQLGRKPGAPLWPERMPASELELRRSMLDAYWWGAMYQGDPGAYGEAEWPEDYFDDLYMEEGETWPDAFTLKVIALDPSKGKSVRKGDYSAIVFAGLARGKLWIDCSIRRRPVPKMCADSVEFAYGLGCDEFGIEGNAFQDLLAGPMDEAAADAGVPPLPISMIDNTVNKNLRIARLGPWLARRKFRLRRSPSAEILVQQLRDFPNGTHDDGPDCLEMAIRLMRQMLAADDDEDAIDPDVPSELNRI